MNAPLSTGEVLERLAEGNRRFVEDRGISRDHALDRARAGAGQRPIAAVLACSDSRVPVETVFDAGIGELFVVRTAGGVLDDVAAASLHFAVASLGAGVVLVLGHEGCGAVEASLSDDNPAWLEPVVSRVCSHTHAVDDLNTAVEVHVLGTADDLSEEFEALGAAVVAAVYGLTSGEVRWLER